MDRGDGVVQGEVWWVDAFGNAQTNISPDDLAAIGVGPGDEVVLTVGSATHRVRWVSGYGDADPGSPLVHADAHGLMAVAVNGGSAAVSLKLHTGLSVGLGAVR